MRFRPALGLLGVALAVAFVLPGVAAATESPATALPFQTTLPQEGREAGLWYTQDLKFDEIRDMGLTGKGVTIAVIDTAINLDAPELQGTDIEVKGQFCKDPKTGAQTPANTDDPSLALNHGTGTVSMLVGNGVAGDGGLGTKGIVPDAKILFYAFGDAEAANDCKATNPVTGKLLQSDFLSDAEKDWTVDSGLALAAAQAIKDGADVISVSSIDGDVGDWQRTQIFAMRQGVPIVAGTPNPDDGATMKFFGGASPYSENGVVSVSGVDENLELIHMMDSMLEGTKRFAQGSTNLAFIGPGTNILVPSEGASWGPGLAQGTSLTTPLVAGSIALGLEKYPKATAFQVLQSMVRTTGSGEYAEQPEWLGSGYGYGIVNPTGMLAVDPTQFPDKNPLFIVSLDELPCYAGGAPGSMGNCIPGISSLEHNEPTAAEVWPPKPTAAEKADAEAAAEAAENDRPDSIEATVVGGVIIAAFVLLGLGVVATAIVVPIVVSRSRKKKRALAAQGPPTGWSHEQAAAQAPGAHFDPNVPAPTHQYPQMPSQPLTQQPPTFEGERSE